MSKYRFQYKTKRKPPESNKNLDEEELCQVLFFPNSWPCIFICIKSACGYFQKFDTRSKYNSCFRPLKRSLISETIPEALIIHLKVGFFAVCLILHGICNAVSPSKFLHNLAEFRFWFKHCFYMSEMIAFPARSAVKIQPIPQLHYLSSLRLGDNQTT